MSHYRPLSAVILAAGEGTRMRSDTPKVLHPLCGRAMLLHVVDALAELPLQRIVIVVGHGAERVTKTVQDQLATEVPVEFVEQRVQRGTGDAVSVALTAAGFDDLDAEDDLLVLPGDAPLVRAETLAHLATEHRLTDAAAAILTATVPDPTGLGRVLRDKHGEVSRVVEHVDATDDERAVHEVNTSIYCFRRTLLAPALRRLSPENAQGEYYLTDAIEVLRGAGHKVIARSADDPGEAIMVNDRAELAAAEQELRARINRRWMREGVTLVDPATTYIDASAVLDPDVRVLPGTAIEGRTAVGTGSVIGPNTRLSDAVIGERATISFSVVLDAEIGDDASVGPFAYVRPGTRLGAGAKIGTFVETKNADIGDGTKVPHLSYIGDADVGPGTNLGASTITANYDGTDKHRTRIGRGVHTGIHTSLRAPVELGDGVETGAGSVVTNDVPPNTLVKGVPARDAGPSHLPVREDGDGGAS
ncbi:MAG TPA: bifunctional UDP-N-acetylglucosamine diphosphorylase/glucosamine-1-phosphate N-acetyltransferase GlmU [Acidimicrobiia bacterium]|nr:bifunctional UDP-N-acetylglucosamine diphosphorylase/glucosamine-1-phosphate N-acetyltransferase GlmU [Acidimicrobiia bacterium]